MLENGVQWDYNLGIYLPRFDSEAICCILNKSSIQSNVLNYAGGVILPKTAYAVSL